MEFLPQFAVSLAVCFAAEDTTVKNKDLSDAVHFDPILEARRQRRMLSGWWRLFVVALIRQWKWKPRFRCASKASKLPSRVRGADLLPSLARLSRALIVVYGVFAASA